MHASTARTKPKVSARSCPIQLTVSCVETSQISVSVSQSATTVTVAGHGARWRHLWATYRHARFARALHTGRADLMLSKHAAASLDHVVHSPANLCILRARIATLLRSLTTVLHVADRPVSAIDFRRFIYAVEAVAAASVTTWRGTLQRAAIRGLTLNAHVLRQRSDGRHTHDVAVQALVLQLAHHAPARRCGGSERRCGDAVVAVAPPRASVQPPRPRLPRGRRALRVVAVELRRLAQAAALRRLRVRLRDVGGDGALRLQVRLGDVGRGQVFGAQRPRQRQLRPQAQGEGIREDSALGASPGSVQ